jgi:Zn finger protein HypA/HybF involved in hydrogenase expression
MHELSITQSVLSIALEAARDAGATRITAIDLVVRDLLY